MPSEIVSIHVLNRNKNRNKKFVYQIYFEAENLLKKAKDGQSTRLETFLLTNANCVNRFSVKSNFKDGCIIVE